MRVELLFKSYYLIVFIRVKRFFKGKLCGFVVGVLRTTCFALSALATVGSYVGVLVASENLGFSRLESGIYATGIASIGAGVTGLIGWYVNPVREGETRDRRKITVNSDLEGKTV